MKVYRLNIQPDEAAGEGEDHDEYFASLDAARRRRAELIRANPEMEGHRTESDFAIERVTLADLPPAKLVLAVLNRKGYAEKTEMVVPEYVSPSMREYYRERAARKAGAKEAGDAE